MVLPVGRLSFLNVLWVVIAFIIGFLFHCVSRFGPLLTNAESGWGNGQGNERFFEERPPGFEDRGSGTENVGKLGLLLERPYKFCSRLGCKDVQFSVRSC